VPIKRGFASVAFDELAWHEDLRQAAGSAKRIGEEARSRLEREGQAIVPSSPATRRRGMGPVFRAASRSTFLLPADLSASSSDSRKGRMDGSTSTIWLSASGTCRRVLAAKASTNSHIDG
jgi:hypothetical protein